MRKIYLADNPVLRGWILGGYGIEPPATIEVSEELLRHYLEECKLSHPNYNEEKQLAWAAFNCWKPPQAAIQAEEKAEKPYVLLQMPEPSRWSRILESAWKIAVILLLSLIAARAGNAQGFGTSFLDCITWHNSAGGVVFETCSPFTVKEGSNVTFSLSGQTLTIAAALAGSGITSLNGLTTDPQTFATGTTGTDFGISSAGSTHTFNLPSASAANRGLLTSANWSTFNDKQAAISTSAAVSNQFLTAFTAPNTFSRAQPTCSNLSDAGTGCSATIGNYLPLAGGTLTGTLKISATGPRFDLIETDAAADNQKWIFEAAAEQLRFRLFNDAESVGTDWLLVDRTGTTVDTITLPGGVLLAPVFSTLTADPADAGILRLANGEMICWEAAPTGADFCITGDSSERIAATTFVGALVGDVTGNVSGSSGSTTGNAGTATTAGAGDSATAFFSTGILEAAIGGTGNGFTLFSGPASTEKTFTLPNASATILTTNAAVTVAQGGSGAATLTGVLKGNGTSAFSAATAGTDYVSPSSTETLTNKTLDAEGTGNVLTTVSRIYYRAAVCQNTTASLGFSTPTTNAPAATCVTGTNTQYATAAFDAATDESGQDHFRLPADWTGAIDAVITWRGATGSTNSVIWDIQTICVADAETGDPAFNTASSVTDAGKGTANQFNTASITGITATGCAAGEELFWKLNRDANNASDTYADDAQLVSLEFTIRRAQ